MENQLDRGRQLVLGVVITTAVISVTVTILLFVLRGPYQVPQQIVRFFFEIILWANLLMGANWARWVSGILYGLGGIAALFAGWALLQINMAGLLILLMGLVYVAAASILLFVPAVQEHFS